MKYHIIVTMSCLAFSLSLLSYNEEKNNSVKAEKNFLKKRLKQEPNDQRYIFDLAQIFLKDLKKYDKAIKLFNKSRLLDGEKGWYSEYMLGKCYEGKREWDTALKYYNSAFERRPTRAEPLYDISRYYFEQFNFPKVYHYATLGNEIPYPKDDSLFVEEEIYTYKFKEQLSVAAYYTENKRDFGIEYIDQLLFDRHVPHHVKKNCHDNLMYYIENIKNVEFIPLKVTTPLLADWSMERYKPNNPSIIKTENGYIMNCRSVNCVQWFPNYVVIDESRIPKTKNVFVEYNSKLEKTFEAQIIENPSLIKYPTRIQGLEDLRIFYFKDEINFVATTCQANPQGIPKMCWGKFEMDSNQAVSISRITHLKGPIPERAEKNWLPLVINGELLLIYSFAPYILYKPNLETGECKEFINKDPGFDFSKFAGSAPPIAFDDGYLLMVHEGVWQDRKFYVHRFIYLNNNLEVTKISRPFTFKHKGVEMCCGIVIDHAEHKLIMTLALEDREAYFGLIDVTDLRALLHDLPKLNN